MAGKRDATELRDSTAAQEKHGPSVKKASVHNAERPSSDYASLPLPLLQLVWEYTADLDMSDGVCATANHPLFLLHTYTVRRVCRSWDSAVQQTLDDRLRHVVVLDVAAHVRTHHPLDASAKLVLRPMTSARHQHHHRHQAASEITDVRVSMGNVVSSSRFRERVRWMDTAQTLVSVRVVRDDVFSQSVPDIDWEATLAPWAATIVRLDLSRMLLNTTHLGELLRVAARLCTNLKELLLPGLEKWEFRDELVRVVNMHALREALKAWFVSNGGLRHLHVPFVGKHMDMAKRFLADVSTYCPGIEYLDGYNLTFLEQNQLELVTCELLLHVPPSVWEVFWRTCTRLRSWNTVVLPFGPAYYHVIADSPPMEHMTELVMSHNSAMVRVDDGMEEGYMERIMCKFPRLQKLRVVFGDERYSWRSAISESFTDAFFASLVRHCPELEELSFRCRAGTFRRETYSFKSLLDLPRLKKFEFVGGWCLPEDSVADLLDRAIREKRSMDLRFGANKAGSATREVLALLKMTPTEMLDGVSLTVRIQSEGLGGYPGWSERCGGGRVSDYVSMVEHTHGDTVRVHLHVSKREPNTDLYHEATIDSVVLSINDRANFHCTRERIVSIGHQRVHDDLCGDSVRATGVFVRNLNEAETLIHVATHQNHVRRLRRLYLPGVVETEDDGNSFVEGVDDYVEVQLRTELVWIDDSVTVADQEAGLCTIQ